MDELHEYVLNHYYLRYRKETDTDEDVAAAITSAIYQTGGDLTCSFIMKYSSEELEARVLQLVKEIS